jgi:predicted site-specific integrase-resolvase
MEQFLTANQLCEWLIISKSTLVRWRKDGLPTINNDSITKQMTT